MTNQVQELIPPDDDRRVQALHDLELLDTVDEERFEGLVRELSDTLDAPIAYLALIDAERQWLKAKVGPLDREVPREHAFCSQTILGNEPVVVADATQDERFSSSPLVTDGPELRFYAGVPITDDRTGQIVGTLCIADSQQRELSERELAILEGFARRANEEVNAKPRILVAYAAEESDWVQHLISHGEDLTRAGRFDLWSSLRVASGDERDWKLKDALQRSRSVVLLLSELFLHSQFVQRDAFRLLLQLREHEGARVAPILVESCRWQQIDWLEHRTPRSVGEAGLAEADPEQIDRFFSELVSELRAAQPKPADAARADDIEGTPAAMPPAAARRTTAKLFLSHASEDRDAVRELATTLRETGLDVWVDSEKLKPGDNWSGGLEKALEASEAFAVYVSRVGVVRWIDREVRFALDRNSKDPQYRVIPILGPGADPESLPAFLAQHQWLDLRSEDADPTQIKELVGALLDRPVEAVSLLSPGEAPFRGLLAFDSEHAHLFFGRDRETEELLDRLQVAPFLAVLGDSGSGKSSLVRAGLLPALHRGRSSQTDEARWQSVTMRPGRDPFRELGNALPSLLAEAAPSERMAVRGQCADQLAEGTDGLCGALGGLVPAGQRTLLMVDQFEELFTQVGDAAERNRFIDTLLAASDASGDRPLHVLITMRADFYSHCFEHPRLPEVVSKNQYPVRTMAKEQLVEVIEKPAAMAGVQLEPGLVELLLHDLGEECASLALLEHTLLELWKMRRGETLTHGSYESIGRVQGALEHHAEEVYRKLDPEQRKQARKLMLNLAVPGKGGIVTRRQVPRSQLEEEAGEGAEEVLRHLVDQRLLSVRRAGEDDEAADEVEVAHEALLRGWSRLRGWLREDRKFLLWRQRTRAAFDAWEEAGRDAGALLGGGPLEEAQGWLRKRSEDMGEAGRQFIGESIARARRTALLKQGAMATISVLAVVAALFGVNARIQRALAQRNFALAEGALGEVAEMTEVAGQGKAEAPETVELKVEIVKRAKAFYETVGESGDFSGDLPLQEAVVRYRLANILRLQSDEGAGAAAAELHDEAVSRLGELRRGDPSNDDYRRGLANALYWRGYGHLRAVRFTRAGEDFLQAIEIQSGLVDSVADNGGARHLYLSELGRTQNGLGISLRRQERWEEAEESYERARARFEEAIRELGPAEQGESRERYRQGLAWALTNLAELFASWPGGEAGDQLQVRARVEAAEQSYREAITILGELAPLRREYRLELAVNNNNLANLLLGLGRYDEARAANARARALLAELAAPISEISDELGNSYLSQGSVLYGLGLEEEERQSYARAREIYEQLALKSEAAALPQYRKRLAKVLANLADLGDGDARTDLCRLLKDLEQTERNQYADLCPGA